MTAAVILVALLAGGAVWFVGNTASDVAGAVTGPTPSPTQTITTTASPSATSSPTASALARAERAVVACRSGLTERERLAKAAAVTARDWKAHTDAQRQLERGTWSPAKAQGAWDTTTARGWQDVRRFRAAAAAARDAEDCRSVAADTASTPLAGQGKRCAARGKALAAVASTGGRLNSQWAEHMKMMANKPHADDAAYHDRWVRMVAEAQGPLKRYARASDALSKAPTCSG